MAISAAMKASACEPPAASHRASRPEQLSVPLSLVAEEVRVALVLACLGT
jgi:hypothetical protein